MSHSVMSSSLQLQPSRLLRLWYSVGKNSGVDCHSLLQGIFLTQGSNPGFCITVDSLPSEPSGKPCVCAHVQTALSKPHGKFKKKKKKTMIHTHTQEKSNANNTKDGHQTTREENNKGKEKNLQREGKKPTKTNPKQLRKWH